MSNRLIKETSPYLLQHSTNPVDWYPWGDEAIETAQKENKPIFLSIGYSACHWCHVMERESFEDPQIASKLNRLFICIKVDREERPDIDSIYMGAIQAMTGSGGWPLSVFLTPKCEPFFGGTYFPPDDRHGMPSFNKILDAVSQAYINRPDEISAAAEQVVTAITNMATPQAHAGELSAVTLDQAYDSIKENFDQINGGFGNAPKFPQPMVLEYLLKHHHRTGNQDALNMVESTLTNMARGGIYDQIGGGFHRYSTDSHWLVPHFEKMLYDNALLSNVYLHAYQITKDTFYREILQDTLDYVIREMVAPTGGFYSSQDADSEGKEGKYYVWKKDEIERHINPRYKTILASYYGVTDTGNFDGDNILNRPQDDHTAAQTHGVTTDILKSIVTDLKTNLMKARHYRASPPTDTKVLTSWNGLMIDSLASASTVLHRKDYLDAAISGANFILNNMKQTKRLMHTDKQGESKVIGYLEDYACLGQGILAIYESTFDPKWIIEADALGKSIIHLFWDEPNSVFYDTGYDHETLVIRPRDITDNATPCGSSTATEFLLRLGLFTGNVMYSKLAEESLQAMQWLMLRVPHGAGKWLEALDFYLSRPKEIVVIGSAQNPLTQVLLDTIRTTYLPNSILAGLDTDTQHSHDDIPILQDKAMVKGNPTAYVCEQYICKDPTSDPEYLNSLLHSDIAEAQLNNH